MTGFDHYSAEYEELLEQFPSNSFEKFLQRFAAKELILQVGFMKSGNTFLRFLLVHYFYLKNVDESLEESLTYLDLNEYQKHSLEKEDQFTFDPNFPKLIRSHLKWIPAFEFFHVVYISRNPLDALVSKYHYLNKRATPFKSYPENIRKKFIDIDAYVLFEIDHWIDYHQEYLQHADSHVTYEDLLSDPINHLSQLLQDITKTEPDRKLVEKSVFLSSFKEIKKMGEKNNLEHGWVSSYQGEFARKGKVGTYKEELRQQTIDKISTKLEGIYTIIS